MNTKYWITLFIGVAALAIAAHFFITRAVVQNPIATVHQNSNLIHSFDLANFSEPFTVTIIAPCGGENTLLVEPNQISITSASCPDQLCVRQGAITGGGLPIICLPHRLVIEITSAPDTEIDVFIR